MSGSHFSITDRAATRIAELARQDPSTPALRVAVLGGGCSGFQVQFELNRTPEADDVVITHGAARVVVDPTSLELLIGAELDYTDEPMTSHFTVHNPRATSSCGCGSSFALD